MEQTSATWDTAPVPEIAALICTYRRREYLQGLIATLEAQTLAPERFEVVLLDDASGDGTWDELERIAATTPLRLRALQHTSNAGPAAARNAAVAGSRAPLLAFTDDDCLPDAGWLDALVRAFAADPALAVVQGRVAPAAAELATAGPWDHFISVEQAGPFFQTCNVAYRRAAFERAGGFDGADPLLTPGPGRHFGEDADLGWRLLDRTGGRSSFEPQALVHHRCVPATFAGWLRAQRQAKRFPGLARRSPLVARGLRGGVFLTQRSAAFDLALAGAAATALTRRPWPLLAALPWLRGRWGDASFRAHGHRRRALPVLAALALGDLVLLASLVQGSVRYRRLVL